MQKIKRILLPALVLYFFSAAGYIDTIDANPSIDTARALLSEGKWTFRPEFLWTTVYEPTHLSKGEYASKMGATFPVLYIVPVFFGKLLTSHSLEEKRLTEFLVSLVNVFLAALLLLLLFDSLILDGIKASYATKIVLTLGVATVLWPYAKTCQREIFQALCLLGMVWACQRKAPLWTGVFFSLGFLTKLAWLVPAFPLILWSIYIYRKEKISLTPTIQTVFIGSLLYFLHAYSLWREPLRTGYSSDTVLPTGLFWSTPFLKGFHMQVTSLDSGVFAFNPILLLSLLCIVWRVLSKQWDALRSALLASILLQFSFYSRWLNPMGGSSLGPRYAVVVLPLFFLFFHSSFLARINTPLRRSLISLLFLYSLFLQIVFVSVKPQQVHSLLGEGLAREATWVSSVKLFLHKWQGKPEIYNLKQFGWDKDAWVDLTAYQSLKGFNFWWAHFHRYLQSPPPSKENHLNARWSHEG